MNTLGQRVSNALESVAEFIGELAGGRVGLGPIVIVSSKRETQSQKAAFNLGRECGPPPPQRAQRPGRRLKLI